MLPPFIIEQIRKREEEIRRREEERPAIRLPLIKNDLPPLMPEPRVDIDEDDNRGVVIIDLCGPMTIE